MLHLEINKSYYAARVFFCQGWQIRGRLSCFKVLSLSLCFLKKRKKRWSSKSVTVFIAINFIQYPLMISENTNLRKIIIKFLIFLSLLWFVIVLGCRDITEFIYHVNSCNHVIERICGFVVRHVTFNHKPPFCRVWKLQVT